MIHVEIRIPHLVVLLAAPLLQESVDEEDEGRPRHQPGPAPHQGSQGSCHPTQAGHDLDIGGVRTLVFT